MFTGGITPRPITRKQRLDLFKALFSFVFQMAGRVDLSAVAETKNLQNRR